jgi:hypothetical protein
MVDSGTTSGDGNGEGKDEQARSLPGARDVARKVLVDDKDPRLPWWVPLPGLAVAGGWAGYEGVMGGGSLFLDTLLWPGAGIFVLVTIATFLGWQLDID